MEVHLTHGKETGEITPAHNSGQTGYHSPVSSDADILPVSCITFISSANPPKVTADNGRTGGQSLSSDAHE
jgi:hypothetical protein